MRKQKKCQRRQIKNYGVFKSVNGKYATLAHLTGPSWRGMEEMEQDFA
jgi:hypothetical protein